MMQSFYWNSGKSVVCMCVCTNVCVCLYVQLHLCRMTYVRHMHLCNYMYACMYVCMYVHMYVQLYIYMCVCVCIYITQTHCNGDLEMALDHQTHLCGNLSGGSCHMIMSKMYVVYWRTFCT